MSRTRSPTGDPSGRRSFLRLVGSVFGAGLGVAAFGGSASAKPAGAQACGIFCSLVSACNGCGWDAHIYHCVNQCTGEQWDQCIGRPGCPSGICYSFC
jgi:hypothetical protein